MTRDSWSRKMRRGRGKYVSLRRDKIKKKGCVKSLVRIDAKINGDTHRPTRKRVSEISFAFLPDPTALQFGSDKVESLESVVRVIRGWLDLSI